MAASELLCMDKNRTISIFVYDQHLVALYGFSKIFHGPSYPKVHFMYLTILLFRGVFFVSFKIFYIWLLILGLF